MNDQIEGLKSLKVIPGVSKGASYVVIAENEDVMVGIKPEASVVYFSSVVRFWQIAFRLHIVPQPNKSLPDRRELMDRLHLGHLSPRDDSSHPRYVGHVRIPACNLTLSPWVVQEHIVQDHLIEKLVEGLYERLSQSGLTILVDEETICEAVRERFLDMIPNNKVELPEQKVYFGTDSYHPPKGDGPPKPEFEPEGGEGANDGKD